MKTEPASGKIMALDVGEKRIGVAISDPLRITAQPFKVILRKTRERDISDIRSIAREHSVDIIVVGVPYDISGKAGDSARSVLRFADFLRAGIPAEVDTWDERFSTAYSERLLIEAGVSRKKRKDNVDKLAAACILQGYLDKHNFQGAA